MRHLMMRLRLSIKGPRQTRLVMLFPTPVATLDVTLGVYDPGDTGAANYQDSDNVG